MKDSIKFLDILDIERKKSHTVSHNSSFSSGSKQHKMQKKSRFPFFKALNFTQQKFSPYPSWLTSRRDFMPFMYKNYQSKLLTIPSLCQKALRASDEKYFISLYLQQIGIFQQLPSLIMDVILNQIKTKKYKIDQIVHNEKHDIKFMAVVFVGQLEYISHKKIQKKYRNQVVMTQAFYKNYHPTIIAKEQTVILYLQKEVYQKIQTQLKIDLYQRNRAEISDMMKSDFFVQLHLKDKRAKAFYDQLVPEFYFKNQNICSSGQQANKFYIHFKGQILQNNHIYIREHNKWPLPNKRWQVRAVYNSYQNQSRTKQFCFFGDQQIIGSLKFKSSFIAKTFCILYSMSSQTFKSSLTSQDFKRLKKYRNQHVDINYGQFQQKIRDKVHSVFQRKNIIRKAINTSFRNKSFVSQLKGDLLKGLEERMIQGATQETELLNAK